MLGLLFRVSMPRLGIKKYADDFCDECEKGEEKRGR
jgi:hypothetical protein